MNGVDILAMEEIVTETTCNWWLAGLIYLTIAIVCAVIGFFIGNDCKVFDILLGFLVGCLVGLPIWLSVYVVTNTPVAYENQYKVTVTDEVSMNEFMEKYEIIEQDGKIYTVRERD